MTTLRSISASLSRLSERMMGQDSERTSLAPEHGTGTNLAAISQTHFSRQGVTPLGYGR